jgi:cell division septum initiation protein DivIVA
MDILYLVDRLEEMLNKGLHVPLTSRVLINENECLDIIDQMRISIPEEVKQAKRVQQEKDRLLAQAQEEAERIVALAKEKNQALLDEHQVLKAVDAQRLAILEESHREAQALKADADAYTIEVLTQLEGELSGFLSTIRNGLASLQNRTPEGNLRESEKRTN